MLSQYETTWPDNSANSFRDRLRRHYSLDMHGATSSAGAELPSEDLDNVLNRFQEWSRKGPPPSKNLSLSNIGRGASSKTGSLAAGARELSYEQALRATSYRRPAYQPPPPAVTPLTPIAAPAPKSSETNSAASAVNKTSEISTEKAASTPPPKKKQAAKSRASRRTRIATSPAVETISTVLAAPSAPRKEILPDVPAQTPPQPRKKARNRGRKSPPQTNLRNHTPSLNPAPLVSVDHVQTEPPLRNSTPPEVPTVIHPAAVQATVAQPAFREVLQQSAGLDLPARDATMPENKTIALSLRVSDAEQARIQAHAARANVSVSAYLRQCALGVEELRDQVELALGELRRQETQKVQQPGLSAVPRILREAAIGWFRRLRGNRNHTGLSLR